MSAPDTLAASLAAFREANRIDGTRASYRKDSPSEYARVMAYLDGGDRPVGALSLMGRGLVLEEDARRSLVVPPPLPPASVLYKFQRFTDFAGIVNKFVRLSGEGWQSPTATSPPYEKWPDGGGVFEIDTPYGPGMKYACTPEMTAPWDLTSKRASGEGRPATSTEFTGKEHDWTWYLYFPSAGNPSGWEQTWAAGLLVQFETMWPSVGQHLALYSDGRLRVGIEKAPGNIWDFYEAGLVELDTWIPVHFEVKWSTGADGYVRWTLGNKSVERSGPTLFAGAGGLGVRTVDSCFYAGARTKRNEVWVAAMQCVARG